MDPWSVFCFVVVNSLTVIIVGVSHYLKKMIA